MRPVLGMRRVEFRPEIFPERPGHAVQHRARGQNQAPARLVQRCARPQIREGFAHQPDGFAHGQKFADLLFCDEKHAVQARDGSRFSG